MVEWRFVSKQKWSVLVQKGCWRLKKSSHLAPCAFLTCAWFLVYGVLLGGILALTGLCKGKVCVFQTFCSILTLCCLELIVLIFGWLLYVPFGLKLQVFFWKQPLLIHVSCVLWLFFLCFLELVSLCKRV